MSALVLLEGGSFVRSGLTSLDFALETAFAAIRLILDYEGTVSYQPVVLPLLRDLREGPWVVSAIA